MSKPGRKPTPSIEWTLLSASVEFGVSRETVRRGLIATGVDLNGRKTFNTREVFAAIAGDLKVERTREARARANLLELEHKKEEGLLVTMDAAKSAIARALMPMREKLISLPASLCVRCNPNDPDLARDVIETAIHRILTDVQRVLADQSPAPKEQRKTTNKTTTKTAKTKRRAPKRT